MFAVILLFLSLSPANAQGLAPDVIYDEDDQVELHQVRNSVSYYTARATVALFERKSLRDEHDGTTTVLGATFGESNQLCREERFYDQPAGSFCSGVLVAPDLVLTAGHCVEAGFCANTRFVLDYYIDSVERNPRRLRSRDIFECKRVVSKKNRDGGLDYALIQLRSSASDRYIPMTSQAITKGQEITLTGFPAGLPQKVVEGTKVTWSGRTYANARLDAFAGSSGSPVTDARTGHLLAILVSGESDFLWDAKRGCNRVKKCPARWCEGEYLLKVSAIIDSLR